VERVFYAGNEKPDKAYASSDLLDTFCGMWTYLCYGYCYV